MRRIDGEGGERWRTMQGAVSSECLPQCLPNRRRTPTRWMSRRPVVSRDDRDDVALALALVRAARSVEQVVDVSAGRYGTAITYGPGQRVTGIVLRRSAPSGTVATSAALSFVVEAHLVVATAAVTVLAAPPLAAPKTAREKQAASAGDRRARSAGHAAHACPLAHRRRGASRACRYIAAVAARRDVGDRHHHR